MAKPFQVSLAPEKLWQAINPLSIYQPGAQFGFFNINLGQTPRPDVEQEILERVGSYGRQLGRIGDALQVLLDPPRLGWVSLPCFHSTVRWQLRLDDSFLSAPPLC